MIANAVFVSSILCLAMAMWLLSELHFLHHTGTLSCTDSDLRSQSSLRGSF